MTPTHTDEDIRAALLIRGRHLSTAVFVLVSDPAGPRAEIRRAVGRARVPAHSQRRVSPLLRVMGTSTGGGAVLPLSAAVGVSGRCWAFRAHGASARHAGAARKRNQRKRGLEARTHLSSAEPRHKWSVECNARRSLIVAVACRAPAETLANGRSWSAARGRRSAPRSDRRRRRQCRGSEQLGLVDAREAAQEAVARHA